MHARCASASTDLSLLCLDALFAVRIGTKIVESVNWPVQSGPMKLDEASPFHLVSNDSDSLGVSASILEETCNGKEKVLEGVQSEVLSRRTGEELLRR